MQENLETISGTVEEVIFKNPDNGYIVITIEADSEYLSVVGEMGDIAEGEILELRGTYVNSTKYGRQFKAVSCIRKLPETPEEIKTYLGSGIIKGVGPALAKKIVNAFGDQSLIIIENDPYRLSELNGITAEKALYIGNEFKRLCGVKNIISFLQNFNIGPSSAVQVWKKYETDSMKNIKENPYCLCSDEIGVTFHQADEIAAELGFDYNNINRIKAGIVFILRENSLNGHTCLPKNKLCECLCMNLNIDEDLCIRALKESIDDGMIISYNDNNIDYIFIADYYYAEIYIAVKLNEMLKLSFNVEKDYSQEIQSVEFTYGVKYEQLQIKAIERCLCNNLFILTGGPGTGKTTTLNGVIQIFKSMNKRIILTAPTGRAAKRMSELTGENAKTIHRLLEVDFTITDRLVFKRNESNPLHADVVIIDEMSMVDELLFESLLRALNHECKLIMVGDSNQLPPVGAGNVLRDLIASDIIPKIELKEIFRQAAESLIVLNAHRIVQGEMPDLDCRSKDFFFMPGDNDEQIVNLVIDLAQRRLPNTYNFNNLDDIQILSPTRKGAVGTRSLNNALQNAINPPKKNVREIKVYDVTFRVGDKVMQNKNDYDVVWKKDEMPGRGIFNGDIGRIVAVDSHSGNIEIDFEGKRALYTVEMMQRIELAYAITIHKSQGSEYSAVIIPVTAYSRQLLYRNLLYTGVTRAKQILILIGNKYIIQEMVNNNRKMLRYSCLCRMLVQKNNSEVDI